MNEKENIFNLLRQAADALVNTFGPNCEVAVHDLADLKRSLIYLAGNVTKRALGAPISDTVAKALIREGHKVKDRCGYKTILDDGRELKSTTCFIRNEKSEVIAAFCINFDTTDYLNALRALECFSKFGETRHASKLTETFAGSINETVDALFEKAVEEIGKRPATMSKDEKILLVKNLDGKGVFQIKGVVNQVALRLGVSNFTVYNYLKQIRAEKVVLKTG